MASIYQNLSDYAIDDENIIEYIARYPNVRWETIAVYFGYDRTYKDQLITQLRKIAKKGFIRQIDSQWYVPRKAFR